MRSGIKSRSVTILFSIPRKIHKAQDYIPNVLEPVANYLYNEHFTDKNCVLLHSFITILPLNFRHICKHLVIIVKTKGTLNNM